MKILYIGGTGEISFSCVLESLGLGHDVSVFNRGQTEQPLPASVRQITGDLADDAAYARLKKTFAKVRVIKPSASRGESAETYVVARGLTGL